MDLDGDLGEAEVVTEVGDAGDVDAGDAGAAEVDRDAVGLAVVEGGGQSLRVVAGEGMGSRGNHDISVRTSGATVSEVGVRREGVRFWD